MNFQKVDTSSGYFGKPEAFVNYRTYQPKQPPVTSVLRSRGLTGTSSAARPDPGFRFFVHDR